MALMPEQQKNESKVLDNFRLEVHQPKNYCYDCADTNLDRLSKQTKKRGQAYMSMGSKGFFDQFSDQKCKKFEAHNFIFYLLFLLEHKNKNMERKFNFHCTLFIKINLMKTSNTSQIYFRLLYLRFQNYFTYHILQSVFKFALCLTPLPCNSLLKYQSVTQRIHIIIA